jgi:threonyl-tRNA synthetase
MAIGQREVDEQTVAIRRLGSKHQKVESLDDAIAALRGEIASRGHADQA